MSFSRNLQKTVEQMECLRPWNLCHSVHFFDPKKSVSDVDEILEVEQRETIKSHELPFVLQQNV